MGNYHISIEGLGAHHNPDNEGDANRLAGELVEKLRAHGHTVTRATFTHGGAERLGEEHEHEVRSHPSRVDGEPEAVHARHAHPSEPPDET